MKSCGNNIEKQHADHITKIYQTGKKEVSKTKNRQMNGKKCKWDFQCVRARRLYMHSVWYNCHRIFSLMSSWFSSRWIFFCSFHGVRNGWQFSFDFFFHFYFLTISPAFSLCQTFKPLCLSRSYFQHIHYSTKRIFFTSKQFNRLLIPANLRSYWHGFFEKRTKYFYCESKFRWNLFFIWIFIGNGNWIWFWVWRLLNCYRFLCVLTWEFWRILTKIVHSVNLCISNWIHREF